MACSNCGYSGAHSRHSCPNCNPVAAKPYTVEQAQSDRAAGYKFGHALVTGIIWLLTNRYLSYVWFVLVWIITSFVVGEKLGLVSEDWMESSFGFQVFAVIAPFVAAIVFRKQIPDIMKWVWRGLLALLAGLLVMKCVGNEEPAVQSNPVTQAAPSAAGAPSADRVEAARRAVAESASSEITFIAPGTDDTPNIIFEGVSMRLCEIDYPIPEVCHRYCATLAADAQPQWCE